MLTITEAHEKIIKFFKQEFHKDVTAIKFRKLKKTAENGWTGIIELTESNEYLSKLGYPAVYDNNVYDIELDTQGEVINFCDQREETNNSD